ncbi:MAG: hypothetical protein ACOYYS_08240 [Chloroflexota bacterium]
MLSTDTLHHEILWNRLQEPIYPSPLPQDYLLLLAALDTGWEIKGPVRLMTLAADADQDVYLFTLCHTQIAHTIQLGIPVGPVIENFLCEEGVVVLVNDDTYTLLHPGLVC